MREVMYKSAGKDETLINSAGNQLSTQKQGGKKKLIFTLHQTQKSILGGFQM